ncbi:uncharacterized protein [Argopecten irradians]|uniref:uncharacterized protein n=1 Tax=Argopecten irradians TaxID=31199 RepID=UPI00371C49F2
MNRYDKNNLWNLSYRLLQGLERVFKLCRFAPTTDGDLCLEESAHTGKDVRCYKDSVFDDKMGETSQKSSSTRWFIAMMATHFVLSVPILSLVTMMYTRQNEMMNIEEECDLLERFPGFFRDIAQQEWHENNLVRSVPFTDDYIRDDCTSLIQAGNTKMCQLKLELATNHGCCKT